MSHELTTYFSIFNLFKLNELWPYYQKHVHKPDNFESHNSLKLIFTNVRGLRSLLESNSPDILALRETNLDDLIDFGNFSARGYLPLIRKDSSTRVHGLAVYLKKGLAFARNFSRKPCRFLLCFRLALLHSVSYTFFYK